MTKAHLLDRIKTTSRLKLSASQLSILLILDEHKGTLTVNELQALTGYSINRCYTAANILHSLGFICRKHQPKGGRREPKNFYFSHQHKLKLQRR